MLTEMGDDEFDSAFPDTSAPAKRQRRRRRQREQDADRAVSEDVVAADNARIDEDGACMYAAAAKPPGVLQKTCAATSKAPRPTKATR